MANQTAITTEPTKEEPENVTLPSNPDENPVVTMSFSGTIDDLTRGVNAFSNFIGAVGSFFDRTSRTTRSVGETQSTIENYGERNPRSSTPRHPGDIDYFDATRKLSSDLKESLQNGDVDPFLAYQHALVLLETYRDEAAARYGEKSDEFQQVQENYLETKERWEDMAEYSESIATRPEEPETRSTSVKTRSAPPEFTTNPESVTWNPTEEKGSFL